MGPRRAQLIQPGACVRACVCAGCRGPHGAEAEELVVEGRRWPPVFSSEPFSLCEHAFYLVVISMHIILHAACFSFSIPLPIST